ncbi:hypothetical protein N7468_008223 [Penicillium chermesinum]|uniref:Uncharacterized protein n=1 Tax=Penicillium chermesinum TaxID=63820 RepID=A0A9W9NPC8_9EURO|nr:uncharacterized protein N7468_008223 [Penicillium chermesinum]KAJ5223681.1 hypothetical protein N7468_008223 [Penicillium chermesinum]
MADVCSHTLALTAHISVDLSTQRPPFFPLSPIEHDGRILNGCHLQKFCMCKSFLGAQSRLPRLHQSQERM